ncbi:MAG: MMPL family transporter, partial [Clostridia bacterium]|nr:MMPL family transporter [Clostridia bacterium]
LAFFCALLIPKVTINKDQSKYLAKDSNMNQGLEIMKEEFPVIELKDSFQIMFEGLTHTERQAIHQELIEFEGVESVDYDVDSIDHNSKTFAMYVVHTDYVGDNDKVSAIIKQMHNRYEDTHTVYSYYSGAQLDVLDRLIPMAIIVGVIILLLMCKSFFEPVLLLVSIGVAILINMGSNVIFESVSDMTFSIAAIFQLVLSIDYSIMLLHRYQQEFELLGKQNKPKAMRNAIVNAFGSVSSSSLTTIIGLLVLLLMSFTIGRDIGLVISKGVFFSLICVFTVMPSLILWFDDVVVKLDKNNLKKRFQKRVTANFEVAVEGVDQEVIEASTEEAIEEVTEEAIEEVTEEATEEVTEEAVEEVTEEEIEEAAVAVEGGNENV